MKHYDSLLGENNKTLISFVVSSPEYDVIKTNTTYDEICSDCRNPEQSNKSNKNFDHNDYYPNHPISYKINNFGFRSDDFIEKSVKENYMYLGCSNTFGLGVPESIRWTNLLNEKLGGDKLINVGTIGGNIDAIGYNFFKMIKEFGCPKGVFIYLPNLDRKILFNGKDGQYYLSPSYSKLGLNTEDLVLRSVSIINSIEAYCNLANIPFLYSSWDPKFLVKFQQLADDGIISKKHFVNLIDKDVFDKAEKIEVPDAVRKNKYWNNSRDGHDSGERHWYVNAIFQNKLKEEYGL